MPVSEDFVLRVTAGPDYDLATHQEVAVNTPKAVHISNQHLEANVNVRIQKYRGLPLGSPESSPYFSDPTHTSDMYSIAFSFRLRKGVSGDALVFGNDFDHPIRDRLPPGFSTAFKIVKWAVDPGLDGDVLADEPYLYGPLLSSLNILRLGDKPTELPPVRGEEVYEEGADGSGVAVRREKAMPEDAAQRKKHFLDKKKREAFEFDAGRVFYADFYNPYLDFNEFSLKLPGFSLPVIRYWDGQPLRYVLRNRVTREVYLVVLFTLIPKQIVEQEEQAFQEAQKKTSKADEAVVAVNDDDDVD